VPSADGFDNGVLYVYGELRRGRDRAFLHGTAR